MRSSAPRVKRAVSVLELHRQATGESSPKVDSNVKEHTAKLLAGGKTVEMENTRFARQLQSAGAPVVIVDAEKLYNAPLAMKPTHRRERNAERAESIRRARAEALIRESQGHSAHADTRVGGMRVDAFAKRPDRPRPAIAQMQRREQGPVIVRPPSVPPAEEASEVLDEILLKPPVIFAEPPKPVPKAEVPEEKKPADPVPKAEPPKIEVVKQAKLLNDAVARSMLSNVVVVQSTLSDGTTRLDLRRESAKDVFVDPPFAASELPAALCSLVNNLRYERFPQLASSTGESIKTLTKRLDAVVKQAEETEKKMAAATGVSEDLAKRLEAALQRIEDLTKRVDDLASRPETPGISEPAVLTASAAVVGSAGTAEELFARDAAVEHAVSGDGREQTEMYTQMLSGMLAPPNEVMIDAATAIPLTIDTSKPEEPQVVPPEPVKEPVVVQLSASEMAATRPRNKRTKAPPKPRAKAATS